MHIYQITAAQDPDQQYYPTLPKARRARDFMRQLDCYASEDLPIYKIKIDGVAGMVDYLNAKQEGGVAAEAPNFRDVEVY